MAKVTGIGGIFFKARDPGALKQWYADHLGMTLESWGGVVFDWKDDAAHQKVPGATVWHVAAADTTWFAPSEAAQMINYRVDDLVALLAQLDAAGIPCLKGPDEEFNGLFAWILDPEGNKVELWEPRA